MLLEVVPGERPRCGAEEGSALSSWKHIKRPPARGNFRITMQGTEMNVGKGMQGAEVEGGT